MASDGDSFLNELVFLKQLFSGQHQQDNTNRENLPNQKQCTPNSFWKTIENHGDETDARFYRSWVQWISAAQDPRLLSPILNRELYWLLIQNGLASDSAERQKYSLYIFRKSILLIGNHVKATCVSMAPSDATAAQVDVERYCAIFETIIHGRYVNQVHECLKLIPKDCLQDRTASAPSFQLHSSWWTVFFLAALKLTQVTNVQRIVGTFIMNLHITAIAASDLLCKLFNDVFIPWACYSPLYTSTIRRRKELVVCEHGDSLSRFLSTLLQAVTQEEWRRRLSFDILATLGSIPVNYHALGYILQGLDMAGTPHTKVETFQVTTLLTSRMFPKVPLNIIVRDIYETHLRSILGAFGSLDTHSNEQTGEKAEHESGVSAIDSLSTLVSCLKDPGNQVLKHTGLADVCTRLTKLLQTNDGIRSSPRDLSTVLHLLWNAYEEQRHTALSSNQIIRLFTQVELLALSLNNNDVSQLIAHVILKISMLSRSKIRLWNPLALAVREIYFERPDLRTVVPIREILQDFAREPPAPSTIVLLDCAISQSYKMKYNEKFLALQANETLGHACLFDIMNNLQDADQEMGRSIILYLLKPWVSNSKESRPTGFPKRMSSIQAILILAGKCINTDDEIRELQGNIMVTLGFGISPVARYLFQWIALAMYWKAPDEDGFMKLLRQSINEDVFPKLIVSLIRIGAGLVTHPLASNAYIESFLHLLPTFAAFDKVAVRHEAQWNVSKVMDMARERNITNILYSETYITLEQHIRSLKNFKQPPISWRQEEFLPRKDQNLAKLFGDEYYTSDVFIASGPTVEDFQKLPTVRCSGSRSPYLPIGDNRPANISPNVRVAAHTQLSDSTVRLQSKALGLDLASLDFDTHVPIPKASIILVASLIDSEYNLGGLSRVAEIFGCAELHVANIAILKSNAFTSTSTSSEQHIPIVQTPITDIASFLRERRISGWTILGIEQTDSSKILGQDSTRLPSKLVILIGAEKTGIPANLLVECDECIEIKQWGVTRSLNVQTAAATVLYEYRRQWDGALPPSTLEI